MVFGTAMSDINHVSVSGDGRRFSANRRQTTKISDNDSVIVRLSETFKFAATSIKW